MNGFTVRRVEANDLPRLAQLEQEVWGDLGTAVYGVNDLAKWLANDSPFFLLAEADGVLGGYFYGQTNDFSLALADDYTEEAHLTKTGYTLHKHDPKGDSAYGISVVSRMKGSARALNMEVYRLAHALKKRFYFGYSRMSGFDRYVGDLPDEERTLAGSVDPYVLALWYAHRCMKLIGAKIWSECPPEPALSLPFPTIPDPVMTFHAKGTGFGLLRVVPDFMPDPESRNFASFHAYKVI